MGRRRSSAGIATGVAAALVMAVLPSIGQADHTAPPASVAIAGDLQSELGCPGDWQPECAATDLAFDADDGVWQGTFNVPAGAWEYKAPLNDSWTENYGAGAVLDGPNIGLTLAAPTDVKFYYDHETHWVTDNVNSTIAAAAGSFQSELGCPGDWQPVVPAVVDAGRRRRRRLRVRDRPDPGGSYEFKVALDEAWDTSFPAANVPFTAATGDTVTFAFDSVTTDVTVTITPPAPTGPTSVTIAGSLQDELGCPGDWQPDCAATHIGFDAEDDVWQGTFSLPAGTFEYKAAIDDSWDENYGANAQFNGANIPLDLAAATDVKFYCDDKSNWVTDNVNSAIATAAGSFQSELGCAGDWDPSCLRSWMQDVDGDGVYMFATDQIPAGSYEFKVARDEDWAESYPAANVAVHRRRRRDRDVHLRHGGQQRLGRRRRRHRRTRRRAARHPAGARRRPGQRLLLRDARPLRQRRPEQRRRRRPPAATRWSTGFDPTHKGFYHGGDLAGLEAQLPYLDGLGVNAIWMTPQFTNRWVQGEGTPGGTSAGYHGYWQTDYSSIDPHFGTNAEMQSLVTAAHALGIDIYFDIVANHTGDVITYVEGDNPPYIDKADLAVPRRERRAVRRPRLRRHRHVPAARRERQLPVHADVRHRRRRDGQVAGVPQRPGQLPQPRQQHVHRREQPLRRLLRPRRPVHREARGAGRPDPGLQGHGDRLRHRRLPDRHGQARQRRVLGGVRPRAASPTPARSARTTSSCSARCSASTCRSCRGSRTDLPLDARARLRVPGHRPQLRRPGRHDRQRGRASTRRTTTTPTPTATPTRCRCSSATTTSAGPGCS